MIKIKLFRGSEQWSNPKRILTGIKREDGSEVEEIDETPKLICTAEKNLEDQANEWLAENIVHESQIKQITNMAVPDLASSDSKKVAYSLFLMYDDGMTNAK